MDSVKIDILTKKYSITEFIKLILELVKIKITFLVSLTTALGYLIAAGEVNNILVFVVSGIFLLACGSAALNHLQEKELDTLMERTNKRPLPAGVISPRFIFTVFLFFSLTGALVLAVFVNYQSLIIGLITLVWYNAVYTPIKKYSAFAVIPGSLVGALPPIAGWVSVNGFNFDNRILYVSLFFFIWQIPHFWLLLMIYGEQYKKAGYPVLNDIFSGNKLRVLTFLWIEVCAIFSIGIPYSGVTRFQVSKYIFIGLAITLTISAIYFISKEISRSKVFIAFMTINFFTLTIILTISIDKIYTLIK